MRAGKLRHRLNIQLQSETVSSTGQRTKTFTTIGQTFAAIQPVSGTESAKNDKVSGDVSHVITMRFQALSIANRLQFGSRIFEIISVLNKDFLDKEMTVMVKERI